MSTSTATQRTVKLPSGPVLVGSVYAVCVLVPDIAFTGSILFSDKDPHGSEGPIVSLVLVSSIGTAALVVGAALLAWLGRAPARSRTGAFVLATLSVLTVPFFWSGSPGILGACAATCAGLTRGGRPLPGAARVAGLIGAFLALLNVVLTVGGLALTPVFG